MKLVVFIWPTGCWKDDRRSGAKATGLKLFHNHTTIELVLNFFEFGTKEFSSLNSLFRNGIFKRVPASELPGLIFTFVWALNDPRYKAYIDGVASTFLNGGAMAYYVELHADPRISATGGGRGWSKSPRNATCRPPSRCSCDTTRNTN
jgi:hypothetical protein